MKKSNNMITKSVEDVMKNTPSIMFEYLDCLLELIDKTCKFLKRFGVLEEFINELNETERRIYEASKLDQEFQYD